jgi:hypothetical protein
MTAGLKTCLKISRLEATLLLDDEEDDEDECFDECLDECFDDELREDEDELEPAPIGPSGGSNAKTTSLK